jgi:hypothetical protein
MNAVPKFINEKKEKLAVWKAKPPKSIFELDFSGFLVKEKIGGIS